MSPPPVRETGMAIGAGPSASAQDHGESRSRRWRPSAVATTVVVVAVITGAALAWSQRSPAVIDAAGRSLPHRPVTAPVEQWRVPVGFAAQLVDDTGMYPVVVERDDTGDALLLQGRDLRDGEPSWTRDVALGEVVLLVGDGDAGVAAEPVAGVGPPAVVVALDVEDGRERWRRVVDVADPRGPRGPAVHGSPGPMVQRWVDRVVVNRPDGCLVLDVGTGAMVVDLARRTCEVGRSDQRLHTADGTSWELRDRGTGVTARLAVPGQVRMVGDRWVRVSEGSVLSAWDRTGDPAWSQDLGWEVDTVDAIGPRTLLVRGMSERRLGTEEDPAPGFEQVLVDPDGRVHSVPDDLVDAWSFQRPPVQVLDGVATVLAASFHGDAVQSWGLAEQPGTRVLERIGSYDLVHAGSLHPTAEGPVVVSLDVDGPELVALDPDLEPVWEVALDGLDGDPVDARVVASDGDRIVVEVRTTGSRWWVGFEVVPGG